MPYPEALCEPLHDVSGKGSVRVVSECSLPLRGGYGEGDAGLAMSRHKRSAVYGGGGGGCVCMWYKASVKFA